MGLLTVSVYLSCVHAIANMTYIIMRKNRHTSLKQKQAAVNVNLGRSLKNKKFHLPSGHLRQALIVLAVAAIGYAALMITHAATNTATTQAESGSRSSTVSLITDGSASGGKAVQFHAASSGGGGGTGGGSYNQDFIYAQGMQLMQNGKPYKSLGFNFGPVGSCWSSNWSTSQMDTFFQNVPQNSLARFFAPPGGTDSLSLVQSIVKEADKYKVHLIISLAVADVYGQCDAADSDSTSSGKTAAYYTDAVKSGSPYANWVKSVVTALANDPGVAMWEIINEPWHNSNSPLSAVGGVAGATTYTNAAAALIRASETAGAGKPKQLITLGPADIGDIGGVSGMESIFKGIDVVDDHDYAWDYNGKSEVSGDFSQLKTVAQNLNKPFMIDEAGVEGGTSCNGSNGLSLADRSNYLITKANDYLSSNGGGGASGGASALAIWLYTGSSGGCTYENINPSDPFMAAVKNYKMPN